MWHTQALSRTTGLLFQLPRNLPEHKYAHLLRLGCIDNLYRAVFCEWERWWWVARETPTVSSRCHAEAGRLAFVITPPMLYLFIGHTHTDSDTSQSDALFVLTENKSLR